MKKWLEVQYSDLWASERGRIRETGRDWVWHGLLKPSILLILSNSFTSSRLNIQIYGTMRAILIQTTTACLTNKHSRILVPSSEAQINVYVLKDTSYKQKVTIPPGDRVRLTPLPNSRTEKVKLCA